MLVHKGNNRFYLIETDEWYNIVKIGRRVGNTTRLVNFYIEQLFEHPNEYIMIKDHYDDYKANFRTLSIVVDRLRLEHKVEYQQTREGRDYLIKLIIN